MTGKFVNCTSGNVGTIFALVMLPIFGAMGAAVDYSRLSNNNSMVQEVMDAATLAAAIEYRDTRDKDKAKSVGKKMFKSQCYMPFCNQVGKPNFKFSKSGASIIGRSKAELDTTFYQLLGKPKWRFSVMAEVGAGANSTKPVELVIAIDTTGSMSFGGNWGRAKTALANMVSDMKSNAGNKHFSVSLIPFADRVNLGKKRGRRWSSYSGRLTNYNGCVEPRHEIVNGNRFTLTDKSPRAVKFTPSADGFFGPIYYGAQNPVCPPRIVGPTNKIDNISNGLDSIVPNGTGRFDVAMAWTWRMLSPGWAGAWGKKSYPAPSNDTSKIALFISDGHTMAYETEVYDGGNRQPWGFNNGTPEGYSNFAQVCERMKKQGIEIHTLFLKGNKHFAPYMKKCASSSKHYHDIGSVADLKLALDIVTSTGSEGELRLIR